MLQYSTMIGPCIILCFYPIFSIRLIINMKAINQTTILKFLLLGLSNYYKLQPFIFTVFLSMYLVTILGNLLIILAVSSDTHLYTCMYFYISNLFFNEICLSSVTVPKSLVNIQTQDQRISYTGCLFHRFCIL
jgi:olfactory receptor